MVLDFQIDVSEISDIPIVSVNGELDVHTGPKFSEILDETMQQGKNLIIINLENVHYIDSTGLGIIAHSADYFSNKGGKFNVICTKPQLKKIFSVSGLMQKNVELYENENQAINRK